MMTRSLALLLVATTTLAACGDSGLNPRTWFGGGGRRAGPETLEPKGGYAVTTDRRQSFPRISSARWEDVPGGRMLIVSGVAPTKGWWDVAIITEEDLPEGRIRGDAQGVLRLRMVGSPPFPDQVEARTPANPQVDTINTAITLTNSQLSRLRSVVVSGAGNSVTLNR